MPVVTNWHHGGMESVANHKLPGILLHSPIEKQHNHQLLQKSRNNTEMIVRGFCIQFVRGVKHPNCNSESIRHDLDSSPCAVIPTIKYTRQLVS
jgi:hypothetical protein